MVKKVFSEDEWKIMRSFRESGSKYLVRDFDGRLLVFRFLPEKKVWDDVLSWCGGRFFEPMYMEYLFQNIKFEDEEPVCLYDYVGF